jgi:hypothetical protein
MSLRPALAQDPAAYVRPAARVATVAGLLDCHPGDVRRLVDDGELEAHGKGVRGIRVYLDSVRDYQDRRARPAKARQGQVIHKSKAKSAASTAAFRAAMAGLQAKGLA